MAAVKTNPGRPQGGNRLEEAKRALQKSTRINKKAKPTKIDPLDKNCSYKCTCCGKIYKTQKNNFAMSSSPLFAGNSGYLNICKNCLEEYYSQLIDFFSGNEEKALKRCCQIFDWYCSSEAIGMTNKSVSADKSRISLYPSKMNMIQVKSKGTTYLDTIADESASEMVIHNAKDIDNYYNENDTNNNDSVISETPRVTKEQIAFFGTGFKPEEYEYMYNQYKEWVEGYESQTKAQEELFKQISIAQLSVMQAKQRGNSKEYADSVKTLQDLMGSANLKPNQNNDTALVDQNTFGTLIKKWEDEKPIPEPEEEFKDVDKIKKYISVYFLGHLAKMMKIDNDFSEMYDDEISKNTVEQQSYTEELITNEEDNDK